MIFHVSLARRAASVLLCGLLFSFLTATKADTLPNTTIRVLSANLNGDTQSYQPFALRILQGLKPDIVANQEFNYNNNTPADFQAMLDNTFGPGFVYFRESYTNSGDIPDGIISRFPVSASGSWVDTAQSQPNRGFAWALLDLPGSNNLYVVSVHLLTSSATAHATEALPRRFYRALSAP
jgi:endonuclease/exonuclease/phosphatase family metal-dependent hydrolase